MKKTYIIAEAGVNHNGDLHIARELVKQASNAGADAVKFQTFTADRTISVNAPKAEYQKENTGKSESQYEMIKKLELSEEDHVILIQECKNHHIDFLSSAFDIESLKLLQKLNVNAIKIPSGEITNLPLLQSIGLLNKRTFLSTGMSYLEEVKFALDTLIKNGTSPGLITVLQCNSEYPTPYEDVNLNAMLSMKTELGTDVGYSDHTLDVEVSIAAVAMGASVIEKHFTLDRNMEGPDHRSSIEFEEFSRMVKSIRNVELAMGNGIKQPSASESRNILIARKSIFAVCDIPKGNVITEEMLIVQRPGMGLSPIFIDQLVGNKARRDISKGEMVFFEDIYI